MALQEYSFPNGFVQLPYKGNEQRYRFLSSNGPEEVINRGPLDNLSFCGLAVQYTLDSVTGNK